ncbi:MAG: LysR family transcriptional regulator [Gammaproteobacteria bacterium]|nr:LysR family transcriptional regulator [Gammaproteobacteria bacterium]
MGIDLLAAMRAFVAVVETESFTRAAQRLELSRGMASRHVGQLEAHLGVRLLNRTTRRLSLTEAGADYHPRAAQVLAQVAEAEAAATRESLTLRGTLRVTASTALSVRHLDRAVAEFVARHPDVEVDLTATERMVDLVDEGFDLALRISDRVAPGLVARRLATVRLVACAAPAYLERHGVPASPEALAEHNCLFFSHANPRHDWTFVRGKDTCTVRVHGSVRSNYGQVLVNAAIDGLGVVYEPTFLVDEALRTGALVRVLPEWEDARYGLFAVYPNRAYLPLKVRRFIDFLVERFGPEPYWDEGLTGTG